MVTWDWDIPNNVVTYSDELGPVFGLQPGEYHLSFENFLTCVHPDDREALTHVITRVEQEGVGYDLEFRFFLPDGTRRWIDSKAHVFCDQNNKPLRLVGVVMNITERKQAEEALRENNERLNLALDAAKMGMWDWDILTNNVLWSPYHEMIFGYEPGTPNRTYSDWAERVHPEDLPRVEAALQVAIVNRQDYEYEYRVIWGDGSIHWIAGVGRCYYNAQEQPIRMLGMIYDFTQRKQAEEKLAHSENLLRTIINSEPECVKTLSPDGTLLDMNPAGLAIIEADSLEQVRGKCAYPLIAGEHRPAFQALVESIFRGESGELEFEIIGIKGTHRWLSTHAAPLKNTDGEIIAMLSVTSDITQQKLAQEELQKSQEQLQATVANLTRSNKELEQFAYVASHDLQEPLRKIKSFSQLLGEDYQGQLDATADEYIHYITNGVTRMQTLISDLLIYSRVGRLELNKQPTDLNAVLSQVKEDLSVAISENNAVITASSLPTVQANPLQMAQLLQNLIANSIKFCSDATPEIYIAAQLQQQEWLISVQDNGIGIKPDYAERIFAIFQRLHNRSEYPGTGIGLAVCRKIVERHGGRIWVESELGGGATFYFTLPT
jgi:PAS domain S-box-containing protein